MKVTPDHLSPLYRRLLEPYEVAERRSEDGIDFQEAAFGPIARNPVFATVLDSTLSREESHREKAAVAIHELQEYLRIALIREDPQPFQLVKDCFAKLKKVFPGEGEKAQFHEKRWVTAFMVVWNYYEMHGAPMPASELRKRVPNLASPKKAIPAKWRTFREWVSRRVGRPPTKKRLPGSARNQAQKIPPTTKPKKSRQKKNQ